MRGEETCAVEEFLEYYVRGPSYRMRSPKLLARATQLLLSGRPDAAVDTLQFFTPQTRSEELLVEFLYGLAQSETSEQASGAAYLDRALAMADAQGNDTAASLVMTAIAANAIMEGRHGDSLRLLNDAAAMVPPGTNQWMAPLYILAQMLLMSHAPAAGEAVLLELLSTRAWPSHARMKITRRLARIRLDLDKHDEVAMMIATMPNDQATERDQAEHTMLLAYLAIATGQLEIARLEFARALEATKQMGVDHLTEDCDRLLIALMAEEARQQTSPDAVAAFTAVVENLDINKLTSRMQSSVIDALTKNGNYDEAWRLSNEVVRTRLETDVNLRGVFDITMRLSDSRAESQFASELGLKHRRLDMLETRAVAVLSALSHGIRDPLTVLHLWFDEQPAGSLPDPSQRRVVDAAIERLERLLDQVVWLARTDRYAPEAIDRSVDLQRLGDGAIAAHAQWADFHEISIVAHHPGRAVDATDPSDGVSALVSAMVSQATAYCTKSDSIELHLGLDRDVLVISVVDDGLALADVIEHSYDHDLVRPRGEGGDATGDVALVLAEALATKFGSTINLDQLSDGRTICSTELPQRTTVSRVGKVR